VTGSEELEVIQTTLIKQYRRYFEKNDIAQQKKNR
jgi:hypothetical protein